MLNSFCFLSPCPLCFAWLALVLQRASVTQTNPIPIFKQTCLSACFVFLGQTDMSVFECVRVTNWNALIDVVGDILPPRVGVGGFESCVEKEA